MKDRDNMTKKIGRNKPCPCGSGKKYKKCCLLHDLDKGAGTTKITLKTIINAASLHISTLESAGDSTKRVVIKGIDMMNGIIVATIGLYSKDPMGIKIESGQIIAYLSSLFDGEDKIGDFGITHFAVRGIDDNNNEIMYVVSSKESARFARNGQSVEWLMHSLFQDNTDETRLSQAKNMISRVEKGLRNVIIHVLQNREGNDWWNSIHNKSRKSAESVYSNKYGVTTLPNGDELIDYTYLPSLKVIILENWSDFNHIFRDENDFTSDMDRLNIIRREESHNRIISPPLIVELGEIYKRLLGLIEQEIPGTVPHFLIENWRNELAKMFDNLTNNMIDITDEDRKKPIVMMEKFQIIRDLNFDLSIKLNGVVVPPSKEELHTNLSGIITKSVAALDRMNAASKIINVKEVEEATKEYERCMNELNKFKEVYLLSEL